jgi:hypothetical protein
VRKLTNIIGIELADSSLFNYIYLQMSGGVMTIFVNGREKI